MNCHPILIVEDEPDLRESLKDLLELYGFRVVTAENGQEALVKLNEMGAACLILLDLMMPVMNGWQFLEEIQKHRDHGVAAPPVIVTSAAADSDTVAVKHGCKMLRKPVDIHQLLAVAREHCSEV